MVQRFFELLEANAEEFWEPPQLSWENGSNSHWPDASRGEETRDDEGEDDLYGAAYEHVVYRDSTADGIDGDMLEFGASAADFELEQEADRIQQRLAFLKTVGKLWQRAAVMFASRGHAGESCSAALESWKEQSATNVRKLLELLKAVHRLRIPQQSHAPQALLQYDRRRMLKEATPPEAV